MCSTNLSVDEYRRPNTGMFELRNSQDAYYQSHTLGRFDLPTMIVPLLHSETDSLA